MCSSRGSVQAESAADAIKEMPLTERTSQPGLAQPGAAGDMVFDGVSQLAWSTGASGEWMRCLQQQGSMKRTLAKC